MPLATDADIRAIMDVDPSITDLSPFLTAASIIIMDHCPAMPADRGAVVEAWLAAHLLVSRDPRVSNESAGGVSQAFQYSIGTGLGFSVYGQNAMLLDPTGGLARWNAQIKKGTSGGAVGIKWLGTTR